MVLSFFCVSSVTQLIKQALPVSSKAINCVQISSFRSFNSNRASITRIHRLKYVRAYPTLLVNPDGSTVNIRYHEPRAIIKLPFDISNLTEAEKKRQLERRKPRTRVTLEEDLNESTFDSRKYLNLVRKK